jgi:hypothetical protein
MRHWPARPGPGSLSGEKPLRRNGLNAVAATAPRRFGPLVRRLLFRAAMRCRRFNPARLLMGIAIAVGMSAVPSGDAWAQG